MFGSSANLKINIARITIELSIAAEVVSQLRAYPNLIAENYSGKRKKRLKITFIFVCNNIIVRVCELLRGDKSLNKKPVEIIKLLKEKFDSNFSEWSESEPKSIENAFTILYAIPKLSETLKGLATGHHQIQCTRIYEEIFSDATQAIFLAATALEKPATILLRRVIELGVAAIYLWDMPHAAYGWKLPNGNLNFTEMLTHLNSIGYREYVREEKKLQNEPLIFPMKDCQNLYGELSDFVHGKEATFESSLPDRFSPSQEDWNKFIDLAIAILRIILSSNLARFPIPENFFDENQSIRKVLSNHDN